MNNNNETILFDDRRVRTAGAFERRKRDYRICQTSLFILIVISAVCAFLDPYAAIFLLPFALFSYLSVFLEWLKVKNNHLIIRSDRIEITDRFNKTTTCKINLEELILELQQPNARGRGILMKFYDSKHNLICQYEDMLNFAAPYGQEKTAWERSIEDSGIKIIDNGYVIKNKSS
ncbi:MAG: hypothetical protein IKM61_00235 [Eubacteriaceae bacterium]|nr:hypothetical protein [Eubacteriaceae bacterium]